VAINRKPCKKKPS